MIWNLQQTINGYRTNILYLRVKQYESEQYHLSISNFFP